MTSPYDTLVNAAIRAPSGDNMQPWRFAVEESARTIEVAVDPARDTSPMNAGQRMSRIAVGAAVENMLTAARHNGWMASVERAPEANALISVQCGPCGDSPGEVPPILTRRVTNRRLYDGRAIDSAPLSALAQAVLPAAGVRTIWIVERSKLTDLAREIGRADALMFGISAVRQAFLHNIRFDRPAGDEVDEGLSLGSLELARGERLGLGLLGRVPDLLFRLAMSGSFRGKAKNLVGSASGIVFLVTAGDDSATDFEVGQLMERTWLELTARDFAVQPMMSLPVLDNLLRNSSEGVVSPALASQVKTLADTVASMAGAEKNERVAAILRFGFAAAPSGRTGRRAAVWGGQVILAE